MIGPLFCYPPGDLGTDVPYGTSLMGRPYAGFGVSLTFRMPG